MLISPPFLLARAANQLDPDWLNLCMPPDGAHGHYPVAYALQWHGGIHVTAPQENGAPAKLRAIADGKVIYVRQPTAFSDSPTHALQYGNNVPDHEKASGSESVWTDDGCVVMEHTTEIGADGDTGVSVTFYSAYMHLSALETGVQKDKMLYRKDLLGAPGRIYGRNQDRCHVEIVCDDDNLKKLVGRNTGDLDLTKHGRSDAVYGEIYFLLPKDTPVYGQQPLDNNPTAMMQPPTPPGQPAPAPQPLTAISTLADPLIVGLRYDEGYALAARGSLAIASYQQDGTPIGTQPRTETDAEYNLYERATAISKSYPANNRPAPSAVYELLRFGRVLNTANETLTPSDVPHWREINLPTGTTGWVNLNTTTIKIFSDADFPHFKGWQLVDDGGQGADSRCDSQVIRTLLDTDASGEVVPAEAAAAYTAKHAQMKKIIAKFPSEWDADNLDGKWAWLKTQTAENPEPFTGDDFNLFKAHLQKLCFWAEVPQLPKQPWHFHPQTFIEQFRMCGWLSKNELVQMVPDKAIRKSGSSYLWETVSVNTTSTTNVFNTHRTPLNKMMRKYGIGSVWRRASLLGNATQETIWLSTLKESGGSNTRYAPWYGRGFLQLTWPGNYVSYWRFRGRAIPDALANNLNSAAQTANSSGSNAGLQDNNFPGLTQQMIDWRNSVQAHPEPATGEALYAPSDSAGFYWLLFTMAKYADETHTLERKLVSTSQGNKVYYRSQAFWHASAAVNLPGAIDNANYSGINGFDSRCCAYSVSIAALGDLTLFPNSQSQLTLAFPESNIRRTL